MEIFGDGWANYLEQIKSNWLANVSEEDVVLIAGDISWAMKLEEAEKDFTYFKELPGKKVFIRGNHDYWWNSISAVRNMLPNNCFALQNDAVKFGDVIICGTRGWLVEDKKELAKEDKKIHDRELIRLELALQSAKTLKTKNQKIICMLHFPPFIRQNYNTAFTRLLQQYEVDFCVFGHLHGATGYKLIVENNNIKYFLTSCDMLNNKLVTIY